MSRTARVCLLIRTHALPPLDYRIPKRLEVRVGSVVTAPLSGRLRLGIVVSVSDELGDRATEELRSVAADLALPEETVHLCERVSKIAAIPLASVVRAALPPGIESDRYRVAASFGRWKTGVVVRRRTLKSVLGEEGFTEAERRGLIELSPSLPIARTEEWSVMEDGFVPEFGRARRQRELYERLRASGGRARVTELLSESGAARATLRALAGRGAIRIEKRPANEYIHEATGEPAGGADDFAGASSVLDEGGAWLWRVPSREMPEAVAALARSTIERGGKLLVLAPEVSAVDGLVEYLRRELRAGTRVAAYHGRLGRGRAAVWMAAKKGEVEVVVGTRAAAMIPLRGLGAVCLTDEPNPSHRAESGHEGLPLHAREVALEQARMEGPGALFLSPCPSLRLYATVGAGVSEIPARPGRRPSARIVDMRGSGAALSATLISACRESTGRVGVICRRLGYAAHVSCAVCGSARLCPDCDIPLAVHEKNGDLICRNCGRREPFSLECPECGSSRTLTSGVAAERLREELSEALGEAVGLVSANAVESGDARVVVGTARPMLLRDWDVVVVPDADALLMGGWMHSVERGFRVLHGATEAAGRLLLVQTRNPEHYALRSALRGDYRSFAAAEVPRLRSLGYPPFAHLALLTFQGEESAVKRAVKYLLPSAGVTVSGPVAAPDLRHGSLNSWRVLLKSGRREAVVRAGVRAVRQISKSRPEKLRVRVEVDPEEV